MPIVNQRKFLKIMDKTKLKVFAIVPSAFCFGLQHVTIDFFKRFKAVEGLFLVTGWNNGDFIKLLDNNQIKFTISWPGMFSRKMNWENLRMSLHALCKLPRLYSDFLIVIKQFKPDVLFFANHHELILLYPVLKFLKIPVVCHMHDPSPAIPFQKKTFSYYSSVVTHFIAISDDVKERTIALGCPPDKITTIHNGIELPQKLREARHFEFIERFGWSKNVFIVGITGQMTETKGHMDLLNAFKIAYQQNSNLRMVFGGRSIEPLYTQLKTLIEDWGMENVIVFSGWQKQVADFFNNIDLFVLASRHDEGYGLVVAEAMAHGSPVIITHSGGAVEIVQNGINGYIVEKRDVDMMAQKILFLSDNLELCAEMGQRGYNRTKLLFNIEKQANYLQTVLLRLKKNAVR